MLRSLNCLHPVLKWFYNYFIDRKQSILSTDCTPSQWFMISAGVPQGSVLGHINDVPLVLQALRLGNSSENTNPLDLACEKKTPSSLATLYDKYLRWKPTEKTSRPGDHQWESSRALLLRCQPHEVRCPDRKPLDAARPRILSPIAAPVFAGTGLYPTACNRKQCNTY